jgi:1-phosphatidylinositol phosphodiesterase
MIGEYIFLCCFSCSNRNSRYSIPSFLSIPEKVALSTRILIPGVRPETSPATTLYNPVYTAPIPQQPPLAISFLSAASFPLSLPPIIARGFGWPKLGLGVEGVNSRVGRWLLDILGGGDIPTDLKTEKTALKENYAKRSVEPRIRGWVFMDYFDEPDHNGVIPLLIECNFRGRVSGEEGWP